MVLSLSGRNRLLWSLTKKMLPGISIFSFIYPFISVESEITNRFWYLLSLDDLKRFLITLFCLMSKLDYTGISHLSVHKTLFYPFNANNYTKFNLNYQNFSFLRQLSCGFIRKTRFVDPRLLEIPASAQTLTAIVFIKSSFSAILIISHTQLV